MARNLVLNSYTADEHNNFITLTHPNEFIIVKHHQHMML